MRNLKRVLSLALASVMLLGMMVVGTSAAGYPDVDDSYNVEAISVLQAVGVMVGDENGNFRPDSNVSRAEMAVVMANLLGQDMTQYVDTCPFTDVSGVYDWARGAVGACYANGIVSGRGEGIYDPGSTVTTVEAASMMMRALGYFQYPADFSAGFEVATISQGNKIGLFENVGNSAFTPMTRNQVAQIALNSLKSSMVDATAPGMSVTTSDGTTINTGATTYDVRYVTAGNNSKYAAINASSKNVGTTGTAEYSVELGEELYDGKLELKPGFDDFQRPSTQWRYENKTIGTYADEPDLTYSKTVKGKDIWTDLGKPDVSGGTIYYVDGDTSLTNYPADGTQIVNGTDNGDFTGTGKGVLTEVYYDFTNKQTTVVMINTYLAQATNDYNDNDNELAINVYNTGTFPTTLDGKDFALSNYKKDDYLIVTAATTNGTDYTVQSVAPAPMVEGVTVSQYRRNSSVTAGGKTYDYNTTAKAAGSGALGETSYLSTAGVYTLQDTEYNLYLDPYGYVIGVEPAGDENNLSNYLFITAAGDDGLDVRARVTYMDGTTGTITISKTSKNPGGTLTAPTVAGGSFSTSGDGTALTNDGDVNTHRFYTFNVDKNGKYELTEVVNARQYYAAGAGIDPDLGAQPVAGARAANAKTVFVVKDNSYTGVANTPKVATGNDVYCLYNDAGTYMLAALTEAKGSSTTNAAEYVFITGGGTNDTTDKGKDDKGNTFYLYDYIDPATGKKVGSGLAASASGKGKGLYKIESDTDGYADLNAGYNLNVLASATKDTNDPVIRFDGVIATNVTATNKLVCSDGTLSVTDGSSNTGAYWLSSDTVIYRIDATNSYSGSIIRDTAINGLTGTYDVYVVMKSNSDRNAVAVYLVKTA